MQKTVKVGAALFALLLVGSLFTSASVEKFDIILPIAQASGPAYSSPFQKGKVQLTQFKSAGVSTGLQKARSEILVPAGTELVLLVDTECAGTAYYKTAQGTALLATEARPFTLSQTQSLEALSAQWNQNPCVLGVSENITLSKTNSSSYSDPQRADQFHLAKIHWEDALGFFKDSSFKISSDVVVAIVDTGIDDSHEDLSSRLWTGPNGEKGANFVTPGASPKDDNGHGTHCAGLVGAVPGNDIGVSGVMFDHVKLMPVKVLDSLGDGSLAAVASGIRYAADKKADIISLSLGAATSSAVLEDALQYAVAKGSFLVIASGNDGQKITDVNFYSPVGYSPSIAGALSVGSIDALSGRKSTFSNYSADYVEMAAPGSAGVHQILSTWIGNTYKGEQGTSMATPLVAGAAALTVAFLKSHNISYTPALIENILTESSKVNEAHNYAFKNGRELELLYLKKYLEASYLFEGRGGFEE